MKTLLEVIQLSAIYLKERGVERARREAEDLIAHVLGVKRIDLYLQFERPLMEQELSLCRNSLVRRGKKEPIAHIFGEVQFLNTTIKVSKEVLIPRQETEILVDAVIKKLERIDCEGKVLWDLCTGSGCIAIAIKKQFPHLKVEACDLSLEALEVARSNAYLNEVDIQFYQGNFLDPFKGHTADFIISNPPYISEKEYDSLEMEVRSFEPKMALVSGPSGLEFYHRLAENLSRYLNPQGKVWLELGFDQGNSIMELFKQEGWENCRIEKDWAGHDRFFFLE